MHFYFCENVDWYRHWTEDYPQVYDIVKWIPHKSPNSSQSPGVGYAMASPIVVRCKVDSIGEGIEIVGEEGSEVPGYTDLISKYG